MLRLTVPAKKIGYNDATRTFIMSPEKVFCFEHCLWAMAEWESETGLCFGQTELKGSQVFLYARCMARACGDNPSDEELRSVLNLYSKDIQKYIYSERFAKKPIPDYVRKAEKELALGKHQEVPFQPTEQIYAALFDLGVDISCDRWHFSRLMSLLNYINEREKEKERMSKGKGRRGPKPPASPAAMSKMESINAARRKAKGV